MTTRRDFLGTTSLALGSLALAPLAGCAGNAQTAAAAGPAGTPPAAATAGAALIQRTIPATGEALPVIGAGTSGSYEVAIGSEDYATLQDTIRTFFEGGGRVFDTSPNYGNADDVLGKLLADGGWRGQCFLATKVAEDSRAALEAQWAESQHRLRSERVDLLLVHNMRSFDLAWPFVQALKAQGATRYIGFTHYLERGHAEMVERMHASKPDFVQVNYSVNAPQAAKTVFPAAQALGIAVMVNRAFDDGKLFAATRDKPLPGWAADIGVNSWAQMFLRFAISHPAVTVVIPATGKPHRQADNLQGGVGPLLDEEQQAELITLLA